jgi:hypothetical protein
MNNDNIVIVGATSDIARAIIKLYCQKGKYNFFLIARNEKRCQEIANEAIAHGSQVETFTMNASNIDQVINVANSLLSKRIKIDKLILAHGTLPDNESTYKDIDKVTLELNINLNSIITFITILLPKFEEEKDGTIAVIGSVAGDRGRQSNFIYATAKGALDVYLSGLRNKLFDKGINVLTIKPGFVNTNMTKDIPKNPLFAEPESVAKDIILAIEKEKSIIYTPFFWRYIMLIIKSIPESIFKKLKL